MTRIIKFFDKLEDRVRNLLSHYPLVYALIGGVSVVLFWRGVWDIADIIHLSPMASLIISVIVMMITGLFVSFFIGDRIILSGLKNEKKIAEKTEEEVKQEETILIQLALRMERMEKDISAIKDSLR